MQIQSFECGSIQTPAARALSRWLSTVETDRSYLPMMQYRIAGKAAKECTDVYFVATENDRAVSRLWHGWGKHPDAIGNFGNFMTEEACQGRGIGRQMLKAWEADLESRKDLPIGLFCSAVNGFLIDMYGKYGFTQAVVKPTYSMLYKPLDGSPATFSELCEDYYCTAQSLTVRPATVGWRHEIDLLLKFALAAEGEVLGLPSCKTLEEAIVWPHIGTAQLLVTEKDRPVGWSFTGPDGVTHWQIHPKYRILFEQTYK